MRYIEAMARSDVIAKIMENADRLRALGASGVYLYGSHARDAAVPGSDIDIFIDRDPDKSFTFVELTEIELLLRDALNADVDVVTRTGIHPMLSKAIEQSAIKVL